MSAALPPPSPSLLDGAALFLDFDGTLVELAETPDAIAVGAYLPGLLRRLAERLAGRVAVVSGRSIAGLERHLDCAALAVSGSHGLELRLPGAEAEPAAAPPAIAAVREAVSRFADGSPGLLVEDKPFGVALHFRQAPDRAEEVQRFLAQVAAETGLAVQQGKMVVELRPKGANKGDALRAMMERAPFAGSRPLFVGDDVTDEDGFRAAAALGGAGVLVGPVRATAARWRLPSVAALAGWLEQAA